MSSSFLSQPQTVDIPDFTGICYQCDFSLEKFSLPAFQQLAISMPDSLRSAVSKRQAEFLAGRYLAKIILTQMSLPQVEIAIGHNRAPVWPEGVIGTISHHQNKAICAIQHSSGAGDGIGIDTERLIANDMVEGMCSTIICSRENALIMTLPGSQALWLTVIFSAKESLFKALYRQVQRYFDFLDAEVIAIEQQSMTLKLLTQLTPELYAGRTFKVHYRISGNEVLTFVQATTNTERLVAI